MSRLWGRVRDAVRGAIAGGEAAVPSAVAAAAPKPPVAPLAVPPPVATAAVVNEAAAAALQPPPVAAVEPAAAALLPSIATQPHIAPAASEPVPDATAAAAAPLSPPPERELLQPPPQPPPPPATTDAAPPAPPRVISERDVLAVLAGALDRCDDDAVYALSSSGRAPLQPPQHRTPSDSLVMPPPSASLADVAADALRYAVLLAAAPRASSSSSARAAAPAGAAPPTAPQASPGAVAAALTAALTMTASHASAVGDNSLVALPLDDVTAALSAQLRPLVAAATRSGSGDAVVALRRLWPARRLAACFAALAQLRPVDDALLSLLSDALVLALEEARPPSTSDTVSSSAGPALSQPPLSLGDAAALLGWAAAARSVHGPLVAALARAAGAALPPPPKRVDAATGTVIPWDPPLPSPALAALAGACASLSLRVPDERTAAGVLTCAAAPALLCWVRAAQEDGDRGLPVGAPALASAALTAAVLAALPTTSASAAADSAVKTAARAVNAFYEWAGRSHLAMPPARSRSGGTHAAATTAAVVVNVPATVAGLQAAMGGWHPALLTATAVELNSQRHRGRLGTASVALLAAVGGEVSARLEAYDSLYLDGWYGGAVDGAADDGVSSLAAWRRGDNDGGAAPPPAQAARTPALARAAASELSTAQHDVAAYRRLSGRVSVAALASVASGWGPGVHTAAAAAPSFVAALGGAGAALAAAAPVPADAHPTPPPPPPESPLHLAASLAARPSSPPLALPVAPWPAGASSDLPAHQHARFGPAALATLAAVYAGAGHHHHADVAAAAALSPLAVGAAVAAPPSGISAAAAASVARQADDARRALAGAAATLLQRVGDAAVAYAVTGESVLHDEVALLHAYATAGVPHRGMVAALARRLAAKGSVGRLGGLTDAEVARALAALCVGWAFADADAVAVLVREVRDRWRAAELAGDAEAAAATAPRPRALPAAAAQTVTPSVSPSQSPQRQQQRQLPQQTARRRQSVDGAAKPVTAPAQPVMAPPPALPPPAFEPSSDAPASSRPAAATSLLSTHLRQKLQQPPPAAAPAAAQPAQSQRTRSFSTGRGGAPDEQSSDGGGIVGDTQLPPPPPRDGRSLAGRVWSSLSRPFAVPFDTRHLTLAVPPDEHWSRELTAWEPLFGRSRGGGGGSGSNGAPLPASPLAARTPAAAAPSGATAGPHAAPAARAHPLRHLELGPDDAAVLRVAVATLATASPFPHFVAELPPALLRALASTGPAAAATSAPSGLKPVPAHLGYHLAAHGGAGSAKASPASTASSLASHSDGYEASDSGSASGGAASGNSSSGGSDSSSGASGSDSDGVGDPLARRRSNIGSSSGGTSRTPSKPKPSAVQLAAEKARRDAAASLAAADGSLRPLLLSSPYDVLGLVEAARRVLASAADDAAVRVAAAADAAAVPHAGSAATAGGDEEEEDGALAGSGGRPFTSFLSASVVLQSALTGRGGRGVGSGDAPLTPDTVYSDEREGEEAASGVADNGDGDDDEAVGIVGEAPHASDRGGAGAGQPAPPLLLDLGCGLDADGGDGSGAAQSQLSDGDLPPAVAAALPGLRAALLAHGARLSGRRPAAAGSGDGSGSNDAGNPTPQPPPLVAAWHPVTVPPAPAAGPGAPPVAQLLLPLALPAHRVALELRGPHDELLPPLPLLEAMAAGAAAVSAAAAAGAPHSSSSPPPLSVPSLGAMWRHALLTQAGWTVVPLRLAGFAWAPTHAPGSQKVGLALASAAGGGSSTSAVARALAAQLPHALVLPLARAGADGGSESGSAI
jgi:hypothetical protein